MSDKPTSPLTNPTINLAARRGRPTEDRQLFSQADQAQQRPFHQSDTWRVMRIMSEFVEGFDSLAELGPAVTIFGSARTKPGQPQYEKAVEVARLLGEKGFTIITGGGPGMMQAANQGAHEAGAASVGLNIELPFEQHINPYVDIAIDFRYFFVRKTMLVKYAQAFIIFPGGFGTMDELFEALTLIQTGKIENFPIILFDTGYWSGLLAWIKTTMLAEGKIAAEDFDLLLPTDSPEEAVETIVRCMQETWRIEQERHAQNVTRDVFTQP